VQGYRAPPWLAGGNLQTLWPALVPRRHQGPLPPYRRERWDTPDGDFIDVDFQDAAAGTAAVQPPWLVLLHGLEGSSRSHYAQAFAHWARANGWAYAVPHFRGCSGEINRAPRSYHSGDYEEVGWMLARLRERAGRPLVAVGVSLGGNALLRWAEEAGGTGLRVARAVASVSAPIDLAASGRAIGQGFNRHVYARSFLSTMRPKAYAKLAQFPGLFDGGALRAVRDLYQFDNLYTAPLHGFRDTDDYWARASARPHLHAIRIPTLLLNARNDPFVPAASLPRPDEVGPCVTLWQPAHGGHAGFPAGRPAGDVPTLPQAVMGWVEEVAATPFRSRDACTFDGRAER
jgi:predicted alpha/beta-fold hydrolase